MCYFNKYTPFISQVGKALQVGPSLHVIKELPFKLYPSSHTTLATSPYFVPLGASRILLVILGSKQSTNT